MPYEQRQARILINKAGGNAGASAKGYRIALPSAWMNALGISADNRDVTLQFDGEAITIRAAVPPSYPAFVANARGMGHELLILHFYDGDTLCTKICADKTAKLVSVENETDNIMSTAFGVNQSPTWRDLEVFLEERCIPRSRDGLGHYLDALGLDSYDALAIIRKTQGRMAEDACHIEIVEG
jgi:hypothetical protein